jgi:hypothetical protein
LVKVLVGSPATYSHGEAGEHGCRGGPVTGLDERQREGVEVLRPARPEVGGRVQDGAFGGGSEFLLDVGPAQVGALVGDHHFQVGQRDQGVQHVAVRRRCGRGPGQVEHPVVAAGPFLAAGL